MKCEKQLPSIHRQINNHPPSMSDPGKSKKGDTKGTVLLKCQIWTVVLSYDINKIASDKKK